MRVFVTGASGFIGSAIVAELLEAGHQVLGLARSDETARSIAGTGADVRRGSLSDLDILRTSATESDAVIHTAFIHDFSNFATSVEVDRIAIEAVGGALEGTGRPLVVTSGTGALGQPGVTRVETDVPDGRFPRVSEQAAVPFASRGVRVFVVRLSPTVHGAGDHGFVPRLIDIAREKGVAAYVGDGKNRWPAVHRFDAAALYRLAIESDADGANILHGVAEQPGIAMIEMATLIGRHLSVPVTSIEQERASEHFGFLGGFVSNDMPASSAITRERFGWKPVQPGLLEDMDANYFAATANV